MPQPHYLDPDQSEAATPMTVPLNTREVAMNTATAIADLVILLPDAAMKDARVQASLDTLMTTVAALMYCDPVSLSLRLPLPTLLRSQTKSPRH